MHKSENEPREPCVCIFLISGYNNDIILSLLRAELYSRVGCIVLKRVLKQGNCFIGIKGEQQHKTEAAGARM